MKGLIQLSVNKYVCCAVLFGWSFSAHAQVSNGEVFSWNADSTTIVVEGESHECLSLKGQTRIDTVEKHSGTGSLRHSLSDSQSDQGCDPSAMAPAGDIYDGSETFFRWWMKISDDMDWGSDQKKSKFGRLTRSNEKVPGYATMYLSDRAFIWETSFNESGSNNDQHLVLDFDPDGGCRSSRLVNNLGSNCTEWREYILYVKRNTCPNCKNGVAKMFVNGQLADEVTDVAFGEFVPSDGVTTVKYAWAGIGGKIFPQMCANNRTCGTGGTIWVDDISISSKWNSMEFSSVSFARPASPAPINGR